MNKQIAIKGKHRKTWYIFALTLAFVLLINCTAYAENIKRGDKGDSVKQIQSLLDEKGYPVGAIDGIFGGGTEKCVKAFQSDNGLEETGIVDEHTYEALLGWADCEHTYSDWITTQEPDCTTSGIRMHTCTKCGKYEYEDIPPTGHKLVTSPDSNEKVCSICGMIDGEIAVGSKIVTDRYSFEVSDTYFDDEIRDGDIAGFDSNLFIIKLRFTNLDTKPFNWGTSRIGDASMTFDSKYQYNGDYYFFNDIVPLGTSNLFIYYKVADAVTNSDAPIVARFSIDGEKYVIRQ